MLFEIANLPYILLTAGAIVAISAVIPLLEKQGSLDSFKSRPVGDGQHGTARWATPQEIRDAYLQVPFTPQLWRKGQNLPKAQGLVVGSLVQRKKTIALIDPGDVHCLMIGASGVGKTAHYLYPNLEYACASGISFLVTDTKGDVYRNYGAIAQGCYGYQVSVIDLRNPTRSDGANMLHLVSKYAAQVKKDPDNLRARAKMEKYAKITAKTIIQAGGESNYGQNAYFYDAAEGLLASVILLVAEFFPQKSSILCRYSNSCRICWLPARRKGKTSFSCWWSSCRRSTKPDGWRELR